MCVGSYDMNNGIYDDPYAYEIDGEKGEWFCVLWYDGPLIWENKNKTHLLFSGRYTSQFETYELYEVSNERYNSLVDTLMQDKENGLRTDVYGTDVLKEIGIHPTYLYSMHHAWEKLMSFDEEKLRETNPEIFI